MFMELEPRGAPIGRSRGKISQSKGASISGKLLLIYLASSEIIGFFWEELFSYSITGKNNNFCFSILCSLSSIQLPFLVLHNTPSFSYKEFKEKEKKRERASDGLGIVHIHQPPPCWERVGGVPGLNNY